MLREYAAAAAASAGPVGLRRVLSPRLVAFCLLLGAVAGAALYLDAAMLEDFFVQLKHDPYGMLPLFLAVNTLGIVVFFPAMVLQVAAGAIYGFWAGLLISWISAIAGQSIAFLLGRYIFRRPLKAFLHARFPSLPIIDAAMRREGWKLAVLLRLSPILPYNLLNYAMALTPIPFFTYTVATAASIIPYTALYSYLGTVSSDVIGELRSGQLLDTDSNLRVAASLVAVFFFFLLAAYGYVISKRTIRAVLRDAAASRGGGHHGGGGGAGGISSSLASSIDIEVNCLPEPADDDELGGSAPHAAGSAADYRGGYSSLQKDEEGLVSGMQRAGSGGWEPGHSNTLANWGRGG